MVSHYQKFRINPNQIVHEVFEDEVLAINLETGTYYSLLGSSCQLWLLVSDGLSVTEIVDHFIGLHNDEPKAVSAAVHDFLNRLLAERLIIGVEASESPVPAGAPGSSDIGKMTLPAFELKVFTEMQDMLLLDPIHDVEDTGWPVAAMQRP
jgi:hypothetical protein